MEQETGLPCIWMVAGVLRYRLCNRGFECDACPLDAALRGDPPRSAAREVRVPSWRLPDDRRYHGGHAWIEQREPGRVRCGLDAFVAAAVGRPNGVIVPPVGARVERGRTAFWLTVGGDPLRVRSPVSGTVCRRNESLALDPGLVSRDPYGDGWLVDVRPAEADHPNGSLLDASAMRGRVVEHVRDLRCRLHHVEGVGPTLADGGERIGDPRRVLGEAGYLAWLRTILDG